MAKHAENGVQQFAHNRGQGLAFALALSEQVLVEGPQSGVEAGSHQSRHEQGAAQMVVAAFADVGQAAHRGAGGVMAHVQAGVFDPLPDLAIAEQEDLGQELGER